jgi:endoglucanase
VEQFAKRYASNPRVIGMDLRNEIRKAHGVTATWGDNNPISDWRIAAKKSADIALEYAPHWLIFVGGLNYQLDLSRIKEYPIQLKVPNKLVYTGHFYGFSWPIPTWRAVDYN